MMTREEIYNLTYRTNKQNFMFDGLTEDKASRKANLLAVTTTEATYQRLLKYHG